MIEQVATVKRQPASLWRDAPVSGKLIGCMWRLEVGEDWMRRSVPRGVGYMPPSGDPSPQPEYTVPWTHANLPHQNGILIGSAVFAKVTVAPDTHTDHALTYHCRR